MVKLFQVDVSKECPTCSNNTLERLPLLAKHKEMLYKHKYIPFDKQKQRFACQQCGDEFIQVADHFLKFLGSDLVELEEIVE